ncbi:LysR family transcriptional regulator [Plantibacter sp. VKM Ac-2885]|uniref:LysR family transcriptional regulator n=1 Tax=Plantibacter TaxID=190323 RepID=UPI00177E43D5|nr:MULTISPECIES: LysR family transcriptional regulator [Plantibacter]MBD8518706.1 LysR family transcriptional regulator [Plantibacter sp. CFBP 8804]MBD8536047.1 LysR family transcriptional regulator [Plantibacter sp. CFBP 13570]MBF4513336.1 LysR family transcriptional regulator [Plantibacter sp. VKM Ac-2885]CAH0261401.1 HTH-type transcriptional regulator GltC [Plantibacter cousiniae]
MRIDELAYLRALAEDGHVPYAAEALGISQSTLTRAIGRLEADAGVELFDRHRSRLELNRYGEILLVHALRAQTELDNAQSRIDELRDPSAGLVSIAYVSSLGGWLIPRIVSEYRQLLPDIRFVLDGGKADSVLDALRSGSADVAFLSPEPRDPDIEWRPLTSERLALGVPVGHAFADRTSLAASDLEQTEFLAMTTDSGLRQIADAYFARHGVVPRVAMEVSELSTLRGLVRAGVGIAVLPDSTSMEGVVLVPLDDEAVRVIGVATSRARAVSPAVEQFVRFVREEWVSARIH